MPRRKTQMVSWKERAIKKASDRQALRPVGGESNIISIKGGIFSYGGAPMAEELDVIVLDECSENSYYTKPFSEGDFQIPACYALSEPISTATVSLGEGMAPYVKCKEPQSNECAACPHNQFGSSNFGSGKGKACGNRRRLLLMAADDLSNIENAMIGIMKIPPTGLRIWDAHVNWLSRIKQLTPEYCITRIALKKIKPTDQSAIPAYELVAELPDDVAEKIDGIIERSRETLLQPFPDDVVNEPVPRRATKKRTTRRK